MDPTRRAKWSRKWRGRSTTGCLPCKTRRVKCDERSPRCANCVRVNRTCIYPPRSAFDTASKASIALSMPWRTPTEGETFHRFIHLVAPLLGRFYSLDFWTMMVPQAAQSQEQILDATLAVSMLYDIPISGTAAISVNVSKRYQMAIDWYCRSLEKVGKDDVQNQVDIGSLLISSILYMSAEMRHMDHQNLERIMLSAYAVVYSSRSTLWDCKDEIIRTCLDMLIDLSLSSSVDSSHIPRSHRQCAIILALKISTDFKVNELHQLKLETTSIMLDINDLASIGGFREEDWENDLNMDQRLLKCQQSLTEYYERSGRDVPTQMALVRLEVIYLSCMIQYEYCRTSQIDQEKVRAGLERLLDLFEQGARFYRRIEIPLMIDAIEVNFVAGCIFVPWHWRHVSVFSRIQRILGAFAEHSPEFVRQALGYVKILICTKENESSELERELFGLRPLKTLLYWQQHRIAHHLALLSRRQ